MSLTKRNFYVPLYKNKLKEALGSPKLFLFYVNRFFNYKKIDDFDAFIISYPKSGRTWLQNILMEIGKLKYDINNAIDDTTSISDSLSILSSYNNGFPKILATHALSSWEQVEGLCNKDEILNTNDYQSYKNKKVIFLYRDPRDVLVSQYYHIKLRNGISKIEKEDLVSNDIIGIEKIVNFMNKWHKLAQENSDHIFSMSYEQLKKNPEEAVQSICNFLGMDIDSGTVSQGINESDLKKMQKKQASKQNSDPWTKAKNLENKNSFQSRKGLIGEHAVFFTSDQIARLNVIIKEKLNADFGY